MKQDGTEGRQDMRERGSEGHRISRRQEMMESGQQGGRTEWMKGRMQGWRDPRQEGCTTGGMFDT